MTTLSTWLCSEEWYGTVKYKSQRGNLTYVQKKYDFYLLDLILYISLGTEA